MKRADAKTQRRVEQRTEKKIYEVGLDSQANCTDQPDDGIVYTHKAGHIRRVSPRDDYDKGEKRRVESDEIENPAKYSSINHDFRTFQRMKVAWNGYVQQSHGS